MNSHVPYSNIIFSHTFDANNISKVRNIHKARGQGDPPVAVCDAADAKVTGAHKLQRIFVSTGGVPPHPHTIYGLYRSLSSLVYTRNQEVTRST
ncbi:hypothetical protein QTP88_005413 [Uroleucon formosanum]